MPDFKQLGLAVMACGVLLVLVSVATLLRRRQFAARATVREGTVTVCNSQRISGSWVYAPTVRYQDLGGQVAEYTPRIFTSAGQYAVGETVRVLLDPAAPGKVQIAPLSGARGGFVPMVFALTGVVFAAVGALLHFVL